MLEVFNLACQVYADFCDQNNFLYQQPNYLDSYLEKGCYVLCNFNGGLFRCPLTELG